MSYSSNTGKWITPPEAHAIADSLLALARQVRDFAGQIRLTGNELRGSWTGGASRSFISDYDSILADLDRFASNLETKADIVRHSKVKAPG